MIISAVCLFIISNPIIAKAKETTDAALKGFSYTIIYPENQTNKKLGYYDLKMKSNQHQTIQLQLNNSSNKPLTVDIRLNSAKTNNNGVIEYGMNHLEKDSSLIYDFSDIVRAPKKETIPANSSKMVDLSINMPDTPLEGYIVGGIQLEPDLSEHEKVNQKNKVIENRFAFLIGVMLSESDVKGIKPELKLNKVYPGLADNERNLFVNMSNIHGVFLNDVAVDVSIIREGKEASLFDVHKKKMRMAPNTMINFPVPLENKRLSKGKYTAKIHITEASGMTWSWSEAFVISENDASLLNAQIIEEQKKENKYIIPLIVVFVSIVGAIGIFFKIRRKNLKKRAN